MKQFFTSAIILALSTTAMAQLDGSGFYRVQNNASERYVYVRNNKAKIVAQTTSPDLSSIILWKDFNKAASDPQTVLYIKKYNSNDWDITAQDTGIHSMINYYLHFYTNSDGTYYAYGTHSTGALYLYDAETSDSNVGYMTTQSTNNAYRKWRIHPIGTDDDNYFGFKPDFSGTNGNFSQMYAGFAYSPYSSGISIYYVEEVKYGMAVINELDGQKVAPFTPIIAKVSSQDSKNNKLNVYSEGGVTPSNNQLGGYLYQYTSQTNFNCLSNDQNTMRLFGVLSDGSVGFKKSSDDYVPANGVYLKVPAGSPDEFRLVTRSEFDQWVEENIHPLTVSAVSLENDAVIDYTKKGSFTVTYSENIVLDDASKVTLNGQAMDVSVSGNTLTASYSSLQPSTSYTFKVDAKAVKSTISGFNAEDVTRTFTTTDAPLTIEGTNLEENAVVSYKDFNTWTVTMSEDVEIVDSSLITLNRKEVEATTEGNTVKVTFSLNPNESYTLRLEAGALKAVNHDVYNTGRISRHFTTDYIPIEVTNISIAEGVEVEAEEISSITVTYSEDVEIANMTEICLNGKVIDASANDNTVTVNVSLFPNTEYTLSFGADAVKGKGINVPAPAFERNFKTKEIYVEPDVVIIVSTNPISGEKVNADECTEIIVEYNEDIEIADATQIKLEDQQVESRVEGTKLISTVSLDYLTTYAYSVGKTAVKSTPGGTYGPELYLVFSTQRQQQGGVESLISEDGKLEVFDTQGIKVANSAEEFYALPAGLYIVNGKKVYHVK